MDDDVSIDELREAVEHLHGASLLYQVYPIQVSPARGCTGPASSIPR
jgi:hypothetical protein